MIELRKDWDLLVEATECCRDFVPLTDLKIWIERPYNIMLISGNNVGLASFEYPGMYSVHWYYQSARGREAINLGKEMVDALFDRCGAEALRAFIKLRLRASRWACRQLGFKSYGFIVFPDGDENELFCMTKDEFNRNRNN